MLPENELPQIDEAEITRRVNVLREAQIFADVKDDALAEIAQRLKPVKFARGDTIIQEGAESEQMFFIVSGKAHITRLDEKTGQTIDLAIFDAGDFFGMDGLYHRRPRSATIVALTDISLYALDAKNFDWMRQTYTQIQPYVEALYRTHETAKHLKIKWLGPGEFIMLITRRHPIRLIGEILGMATIASLTILLPISIAVFVEDAGALLTITRVIAGIVGLLMLIGITIAYLEWRNDYFIVTNIRVSWRERILLRSTSRQETPLRTIQSLSIQTRNVIHRAMKVGDVVVRTFNSELPMTDVYRPEYMKNLIQGFILRSRRRSRQAQLAQIRQTLRNRLGLTGEEILPEEPATAPPIAGTQKKRFSIFQTRIVEGDTITYRKHWWVFFRNALWPNIIFTGSLLTAAFIAPVMLAFGHSWARSLIPIAGALAFFTFFWWGYEYIDWRNDLYRITGNLLIDRERKPLGQESSRSAPIKNIQSLRHDIPNLIGLLLDVGNVYINVGDDTLNFHGVHDPALVHQDISRRMEELFAQEEQERIKQEHERMATWLEIYHEETEDQRFPWRDLDL